MICFRGTTFCPFYKDCIGQRICARKLTPEIKTAAKGWWDGNDPPIAQFAIKPSCHMPITDPEE